MEDKKDLNNFIQWTKLKIRLHLKSVEEIIYFREREIWWTSLGVNIGYEEDGKHESFERPVLILKKFNKNILWALPITSQDKVGCYYYQFEYEGQKFSVILSQLKLISSKRLSRRIRKIGVDEFKRIKDKIKSIL